MLKLEKTRAEIKASKGALDRLQELNTSNVDLIQRKTQRWRGEWLGLGVRS